MNESDQDNVTYIPIRLSLFVELFIGKESTHRALPNTALAELIKQLDPMENIAHIESPFLMEGRGEPIIWKKRYWLLEAERQVRVKAQSAQDRQYYLTRNEIINKLKKALTTMTGIDEDSTMERLAQQMLAKKQWDIIRHVYKIEEIDEFAKMEEPKLRAI